MNIQTARWALITFWNREDLNDLHRRETLLMQRCDVLRAQGKAPLNCQDLAYLEDMTARLNLSPWWIDTDPATEKMRMDEFEKYIYPIWKGIERNTSEEEDPTVTLHRQDVAIFESGYKVNRLGTNVQYQKKQKLGDQYKEVFAND